jgi:hypothetical protein
MSIMRSWVSLCSYCRRSACQSAGPRPAGSNRLRRPPHTSLPDLKPDANGKLSQEQMQQLLRVVADKDIENDKRLRDYTYIERDEEHKLDGKGQVKSTEVKTYDVMELYGEQVQRLIEKDDKALDAKDAAKEEEKDSEDRRQAQERVGRRSQEARGKRREGSRRGPQVRARGGRRLQLQAGGDGMVGEREAWVIDGEPRPGFVPHMKESKFLSKFRGRVWIDKNDLQLAKMDVECLDTISWGLFLARFHKGSRLMLEQTRVNDEVWLPLHVTAKIDVRLALLKNFDVNVEQTYRDYKKFRATAKIVSVGEVKP